MWTLWAVISCLDKEYLSMFYGSERIISPRCLLYSSSPEERQRALESLQCSSSAADVTWVFTYLSLHCCSLSSPMAHLQLSLQATKEDSPGWSYYSNIASVVSSCWDFWQRRRRRKCSCLFYCFSGIIDRQVIVVTGPSPFECISDFKLDARCIVSILYWQSNLLGNERRWSSGRGGSSRAPAVCPGPREWERRQTRE